LESGLARIQRGEMARGETNLRILTQSMDASLSAPPKSVRAEVKVYHI